MWPGRYGLLVAALRSGDEKAAMDAVLSVKSSSQMLGALWLARMVLGVETAVLERRMDAARAMMDEVELCGRRTAEQLRQDLGE